MLSASVLTEEVVREDEVMSDCNVVVHFGRADWIDRSERLIGIQHVWNSLQACKQRHQYHGHQ